MKTDDIAAYFTKKIAKPINYDALFDSGHHFYAIEVTAVDDGVLHAIVSLRYKIHEFTKENCPQYIGEVQIPIQDGDKIENILDMSLAGATFHNWGHFERFLSAPDRLREAYRALDARLEVADSGLRM